jgi:tRNA(Ile)-lysidine synthase
MAQADTRLRLHPFTRAVAGALRRRCGIDPRDASLLLAVSGGADSTALLRALAAVAPARTWRLSLTVAHIHHGVRPEAGDDQRFVADLAAALGLPFASAALDPSTFVGNREAAMRRARYGKLLDLARAAGARYVVTAHHADDQLETVLLRIARGAGVRGLAGLRWNRPLQRGAGVRLLRPMLMVTGDEARAFLTAIGQPWREDASNADISRARARLRLEALPALRAIHPRAAAKAVALGDRLRGIEAIIHERASSAASLLEADSNGRITGDRRALAGLPKVVLGELLRSAMVNLGADPDVLGDRAIGPVIQAVRDGVGGSRRFGIAGIETTLTKRALRMARRGDPSVSCPTR